MSDPSEEALSLARDWLDEPHGLVWYADEYEDVVVAVARLVDLVAASVASERR